MPIIRIEGDAVVEHEAMHKLGLHHDAPELVLVGGMLLPAEVGNYTVFATKEKPGEFANRIRQQVPGARMEVKRFGGWWKL